MALRIAVLDANCAETCLQPPKLVHGAVTPAQRFPPAFNDAQTCSRQLHGLSAGTA